VTPLHDVDAAAALLGVSVATVRRRTRAGKVAWPHTRIDDRVLFTDAQLEEIVEASAVRPINRRRG
jgi:predicted site-specific integrase-resolvase